MKILKMLRSALAALAVTVIATQVSFAARKAPEINPAMGSAALALIGGAILVIRGRARQ